MAYTDEPNVISEKRGKKRYIFIALGVGAFLLIVFSSVLEPWFREFQRRQTPSGPHGGDLYFITVEDRRFSLELARIAPADYLTVFMRPARHYADWDPAEYRISYFIEGMREPDFLEWQEEERMLFPPNQAPEFDPLDPAEASVPRIKEFYGPSTFTFHSQADHRLQIRIYRDGDVVWEGERWSYGPAAHRH